MTEALILVLLASALRSAVLGLGVSAAIGLFRLRDVRTESAIWTLVLAAAIAMPALAAVLPTTFHLRLPIALAQAAASGASLARPHGAGGATLTLVLALAYGAGTAIFLARLVAGLILLARLYLQAEPVTEPWAKGRAVRFSAAVDGPLSFAHCIVLPADYRLWPDTHRAAVMAHEECHIRRGDFIIQLLGAVHRALFWFSPFAWWLQKKLGELAETASDAAGARRIGDAASYAEILVEVTRSASKRPVRSAMAMAHGPGLAQRVDHILTPRRGRRVSAAGRAAAMTGVALAALALGEVHAAQANHTPRASPPSRDEGRKPLARATQPGVAAAHAYFRKPSRSAVRQGVPLSQAPIVASAAADEASYNPLALLDDSPTAAVAPAVLLTGARLTEAVHD